MPENNPGEKVRRYCTRSLQYGPLSFPNPPTKTGLLYTSTPETAHRDGSNSFLREAHVETPPVKVMTCRHDGVTCPQSREFGRTGWLAASCDSHRDINIDIGATLAHLHSRVVTERQWKRTRSRTSQGKPSTAISKWYRRYEGADQGPIICSLLAKRGCNVIVCGCRMETPFSLRSSALPPRWHDVP